MTQSRENCYIPMLGNAPMNIAAPPTTNPPPNCLRFLMLVITQQRAILFAKSE